ncbi:MAG: hypothetical protein DHS20C06_11830 [Hyphobacterium sp.]|nr:MAG: hypothetical protein DHS20C06_11830 [Hyphobacterium sp.]
MRYAGRMITLFAALALMAQQDGHAASSSGVLQPVAPPPTEMPLAESVPELAEIPVGGGIVVTDFTQPYICCADCAPTYVEACEPVDADDETVAPPEIEKSPFGPSPTPD